MIMKTWNVIRKISLMPNVDFFLLFVDFFLTSKHNAHYVPMNEMDEEECMAMA